jgi:hypothetical protein
MHAGGTRRVLTRPLRLPDLLTVGVESSFKRYSKISAAFLVALAGSIAGPNPAVGAAPRKSSKLARQCFADPVPVGGKSRYFWKR